jgi:hypothetical protein
MSKFGEAFKKARALGQKEFTWSDGKKYNTKTKEEVGGDSKPAAKVEAKPAEKPAEKPAPKAAAPAPKPTVGKQNATAAYNNVRKVGTAVDSALESASGKSDAERARLASNARGAAERAAKMDEAKKRAPGVGRNFAMAKAQLGFKKGGDVMKKSLPAFMKADKAQDAKMMAKKKPAKKYAAGGSVSSRGDGCATKGKTKTKMM